MAETVPMLLEQITAYAATTYPESPLAMRNAVVTSPNATYLRERLKVDFDAIKQLGVEAGLESDALASAALYVRPRTAGSTAAAWVHAAGASRHKNEVFAPIIYLTVGKYATSTTMLNWFVRHEIAHLGQRIPPDMVPAYNRPWLRRGVRALGIAGTTGAIITGALDYTQPWPLPIKVGVAIITASTGMASVPAWVSPNVVMQQFNSYEREAERFAGNTRHIQPILLT